MIEEWKFYKKTTWHNKEIIYEVSNFGRVKKNGVLIDLENEYKHTKYYRFGSDYNVHRVVAELFIPNPDNKPCIDHIDSNTFNNKVDNLRWVTYKENSNNILCRQHLSKALKGRIIDDEWKKNISIGTKKGMANMSENSRNKLRQFGNKYAIGKRTDEQKYNISEATKKAMNKPEVREHISKILLSAHRKWMNNGINTKQIPESEQQHYLDLGWVYGRLL